MIRNIDLLYIREHEGSSHFVPFPTNGVTFKNLNDNLVLMTFANKSCEYRLLEEDAFQIQKTLAYYTKNHESICKYPAGLNRFFLERLMDHRFELNPSAEARLSNLLFKNNIIFVGDLVQWTEEKLLKVQLIGNGNLKAIKEFLECHDLELGMTVPNWERYRPVK